MSISTHVKNPTWQVDLLVRTFAWTLERWGSKEWRWGWHKWECPDLLPEDGLHVTLVWAPATGSLLLCKPALSLGGEAAGHVHMQACELAKWIDVQTIPWSGEKDSLYELLDKKKKEEENK